MKKRDCWIDAGMKWFIFTLIVGFGFALSIQADENQIRLLVRGDDIGSSHAANLACIKTYKEGIVRSVEILVPAPWFNEAVKMLKENPQLDVGVHLDLTSEWENLKWGPITHSPSLVDRQGHFFPMTSQRPDFPPNTGFLESQWKIQEVEQELRAQIELAKESLPWISHLSAHMGTPVCTPELKSLVNRLAKEYQLLMEDTELQPLQGFWGLKTPQEKIDKLVALLTDLKPGTWLLIDHPGMDCDEMRAIGHQGYWDVALDREGVTQAFTSPQVMEIIQKRGIELIGYNNLK